MRQTGTGRLSLGWAGDEEGRATDLTSCLCPQVSRLTWFTRHDPVVRKEPPAAPLPPALSQNEASGDTNTQLEGVEENADKTPRGEPPLPLVTAVTAVTCMFKGNFFYQITSRAGADVGGILAPRPQSPRGVAPPTTMVADT